MDECKKYFVYSSILSILAYFLCFCFGLFIVVVGFLFVWFFVCLFVCFSLKHGLAKMTTKDVQIPIECLLTAFVQLLEMGLNERWQGSVTTLNAYLLNIQFGKIIVQSRNRIWMYRNNSISSTFAHFTWIYHCFNFTQLNFKSHNFSCIHHLTKVCP